MIAFFYISSYAGIPVTGKYDDATKEMMEKPRCGMPDKQAGDKSRRKRRYNLQGTKWDKSVRILKAHLFF